MTKEQWQNIIIDEIEPMEVTDMEKAKVKQHVLKNSTKKKRPLWQNIAAAAVIFTGGITGASFVSPAFAEQIPFMQNIVGYFTDDNKIAENHQNTGTSLAQSVTNKGVTVLLDKVLYDGNSLTAYYAIQASNLPADIEMTQNSYKLAADGATGSLEIRKIDATNYVAVEKYTPTFKDNKAPEVIDTTWRIDEIHLTNGDRIKGKWQFAVNVEQTRNSMPLSEFVQNDAVTVQLKDLLLSDAGNTLTFDMLLSDSGKALYKTVDAALTITDDLGNSYDVEGNGSNSTDMQRFNTSATFNQIADGATKLIITPTMTLSTSLGNGVSIDDNNKETVIVAGEDRHDEVTLPSMEITLK